MKKTLKLAPFALAALMLVGCSSKPIGPQNGNDPIVGENGTTYQEFYDELYTSKGTDFAAKELILRVAKDVVNNSETFKAYGVEKLVNERRNEVLDSFYSSQYKKNGLFDENLLIQDLTNKGYNITLKEGETPFKETEDFASLVKYQKLSSLLVADYSDYFTKKVDYDIYTQLLKEDYIINKKASYFESKKIRKVQYFTFTPDSSSQAIEIKESIENALNGKDTINAKDFEELATKTFQKTVTDSAKDKIAKDYAIINKEAHELPADDGSLEYKYKDEYIDLFDGKKHTDAEKSKVKDAWNVYTNNDSYSREHGYFLKQLDAENNLGYHEKTVSNDDTSGAAVEASIDTKLFKADDTSKSNFLDFTDQGSKVFKNGSAYYVVRFEIIDEDTIKDNVELKIEGANALTKNSTNVKNAVAEALEAHKVNIYEESLHTYLKDTYGFGK